ncbi:hypothetical protein Ahy_B09g099606 isoform B [Arachis hypogaea]|uniref:Uncharacterized protein n=1 Tax=Arachis hypogaea TaxID=3818 RepID=A0A444XV75_ARAHY|nr:hypothetical protein Ahy_B09g099606 isoform B [Arachis hypogaea]
MATNHKSCCPSTPPLDFHSENSDAQMAHKPQPQILNHQAIPPPTSLLPSEKTDKQIRDKGKS